MSKGKLEYTDNDKNYQTIASENWAIRTFPKTSCQCATTENFSNMYNVISYAYNNGLSGVGATITLTLQTNTRLAIDGYVPRINDRILVKNENLIHNGIYVLTTLASSQTIILKRATDYDYIGKITQNDYIDIIFGLINGGTCYNQTYFDPIVIGDSYISFTRVFPKNCLLNNNNLSDLTNIIDARFNLNVYSLSASSSSGLTLSLNSSNMIATFGLNSELSSLSALSSTGLVTRTSSGAYTARFINAGTGISVTNGNGVLGNPTLSISNTTVTAGTYNYPASLIVNSCGQITSITSGSTPITSISLTGSVTGTGGSTINTTFSNTQYLTASNIDFNWPYGGSATYNTNINHYLIDTPNTSSTSPGLFETIQSGSGSTKRSWTMKFNPGAPNLPGPYFSLSFHHNTYDGSYINGVNAFSIDYIRTTLPKFAFTFNGDVQATGRFFTSYIPVNNVDLVNKLYADSLITNQLNALSNLNTTGIIARTGINTFTTRSIAVGSGLTISNTNGVSGDPSISLTSQLQNLNNLNTLGFVSLSVVGTGSSQFVNRSLVGGTGITINNGNGVSGNPSISVNQSSLFLNNFSINGNVLLNSYNLTTAGNISAETGSIIANNLRSYNSIAIVSDPIYISGGYYPYNGSYGFLNSSGQVGIGSGSFLYSLNCLNRIKASEINVVSSIKKKNIIAEGIEIELEIIDIIKNTNFYKYKYKDQIVESGIRYGIVAEELAKTLPDYVENNNMEYIPNIMQVGNVTKVENEEHQYIIKLKKEINTFNSKDKLKIILDNNNSIEVIILDIINKNKLKVVSEKLLSQKVFVYGTYEQCPSVNTKVTEISLIAIKNILTRLEKLERKYE